MAIVGSGPAGLSCAYDLVRMGYPVTVFETAPKSGGMLRYCIPEYRLPKAILDNEIAYIQELGVEIRTEACRRRALQRSFAKDMGPSLSPPAHGSARGSAFPERKPRECSLPSIF